MAAVKKSLVQVLVSSIDNDDEDSCQEVRVFVCLNALIQNS